MNRIWVVFLYILTTQSIAYCQTDSLWTTYDFEKKPYAAALDVFGINLLINRYDAWIFRDGGEYWAKVSPASWEQNLYRGLEWDWNSFGTNWFGHPLHGSFFFNSARSLGMSYWESAPYAFLGSFTWEYFGETHPPSGNDLMTTSLGGIYLGELTHRFSERLLNHPSHGLGRAWRVVLGTLINPMRAFNHWVYGKPRNASDTHFSNNRLTDLRAHLALGTNIQLKSVNLEAKGGGPFIEFDIIYGNPNLHKNFYRPFEFFEFTGWLRFAKDDDRKVPFLNITSQAILWGENLSHNDEFDFLIGAFQHFDYLHDEVIEIGSLGFSTGLLMSHHLGNKAYFYYQVHFGVTALGGSNNEIVGEFTNDPESLRDYILGPGFLIKAEALLDHPVAGRFKIDHKHFTFYVESGPSGLEKLNLLSFRYSHGLFSDYNLGIDYTRYFRRVRYNDYIEYQNFKKDLYELRAFISYEF